MGKNEGATGGNRSFKVDGQAGGVAAVVEHLQLPGGEINIAGAGVEQFNGFVVAGAFHVFTDHQPSIGGGGEGAGNGGRQHTLFYRHGSFPDWSLKLSGAVGAACSSLGKDCDEGMLVL